MAGKNPHWNIEKKNDLGRIILSDISNSLNQNPAKNRQTSPVYGSSVILFFLQVAVIYQEG
jgi:hypothetical protein